MNKIKCPYCGSKKVEEVDLIGSDNGSEHLSYSCYSDKCGEYFYVFKTTELVKIEVSKDKWENYETVYEI